MISETLTLVRMELLKLRRRRGLMAIALLDVDVGREELDRQRQEGWPVDDCCQIGVLRQA